MAVVRKVAGSCCAARIVFRQILPSVGHCSVACALYQAQVRKPKWLARVLSRKNGVVQALGTCAQATGCAADFVSRKVFAVVAHRPGAFVPYQARVRKLRGLARVHSQENGIVQARVGTCAQAAGLSVAHLGAVSDAL